MALVKLNNRGVRSVSTFGSISSLGTYTFIKKITASSSANVSFVNGSSDVVLDNTYKEYLFTFNNIIRNIWLNLNTCSPTTLSKNRSHQPVLFYFFI